MRRATNFTRVMALLGLLSVGRRASGDGTAEIESLLDQSVVTTATRASQSASVAPGLVTVVTSDDMRRYGIHTLAGALGFLAHGVIAGDDGQAGEVGARGTLLSGDGGDHFLLLLNGHILNDPLTGGASFGRGSGIPMELIDHLEVILGPGSVLYGNGAMLGIVNVVTKRALAYDGVHVVAEGEFPMSGRLSAGVGHSFKFLGAPSEVTAAFEYFRAQPTVDYPRRFYLDPTTQTPAGFSSLGPLSGQWGGRATRATWSEAPSAYVRLISGNFELALRGAVFGQGNAASELDFDDPLTFTKKRWASFDLTHHSWLSPIVDVTMRLYGDSYDSQSQRIASSPYACAASPADSCRYVTNGLGQWAGGEIRTALDWWKDSSFVTMLGTDVRVTNIGSKQDAFSLAGDAPIQSTAGLLHETFGRFAVYGQQTWQPARWIGLNAGVRLDSDERYRLVPSPRGAFALRPWRGGTVKASVSQAFRAPSRFEADASTPILLAASNLQPEYVVTYEASLEQQVGVQRLLLGAYYSDWDNLVDLSTLTLAQKQAAAAAGELALPPSAVAAAPVQQYANLSHWRDAGVHAGVEGRVGDFRYGASVTAAHGENDSTHQQLPATPSVYGNARGSYDFGGALPTLSLAAQWSGTRPTTAPVLPGEAPVVAPAQLVLRATVLGRVPRVKGLTYRVSGTYAATDHGPYAVGPFIASTPAAPPILAPVDQLRLTVGLQYDF